MAKRRPRAASKGAAAPAKELHAVIAGLPVVLWACDLDGKVTISEGGGLAAIGFKPGQLVGASIWDLYKDNPTVQESTRRAFEGQAQSTITEVPGAIIEARLAPVLGDDGEVVGIVGF